MARSFRKWLIGLLGFALALTMAVPAQALSALDTSSWQTGISVAAADTDIVIAKATQGTGYVNPDCDRVVQDSLRLGKATGVYHFADAKASAQAEANHFIASTRGYIGKGVMPILDWEPGTPWRTDWARQWLELVYKAYGVKPLIYMNISTENSYDWSSVVSGDYGLWLAGGRYYNQRLTKDQAPAPYWRLRNWRQAAMWQYTSNGRVYGWAGGVDLSEFYGDIAAWNRYAASHAAVPPVVAPAPAPVRNPTVWYTVMRGDTLSSIGYRHGVSWPSIAQANSIRPPYTIYPGQRLALSGATAVSYVVRPGDTLWGIASSHGVPMGSIHGYRSGNPNVIYVGETLTW